MHLVVDTLSSHASVVVFLMHVLKVVLSVLEIGVKQRWAPVIAFGTYDVAIRNIAAVRMYQVTTPLMNMFACVIDPSW